MTRFPGHPVLVISSFGLFGFFAFALMPVCLEVGVECTYPVAEATSAGLQWMAGYAAVVVTVIKPQPFNPYNVLFLFVLITLLNQT